MGDVDVVKDEGREEHEGEKVCDYVATYCHKTIVC